MTLIKMLHRFNTQFLLKLPRDVYIKSLASLGCVLLVCAIIWVAGPRLAWNAAYPLLQIEKRIYIMTALLLLWALKVLLIDLDIPNPTQHKDPVIAKKLTALQSRFFGAIRFLQKTMVTKQGKSVSLDSLPWYLLIGPSGAGKSSLLANSDVNFILQKQLAAHQATHLESSESCDWWITRDVCIVDVPGKYLLLPEAGQKKLPAYNYVWQFFLSLLKKYRGRNGIAGIILALPLPELMKQSDLKQYHKTLKSIFYRLNELQKQHAEQEIPCHIIITKCDLLPGFVDFFTESANEEISQAWGVSLGKSKSGEKIDDVFAHRFDALIKKVNQQLIWRLHHERNPMARPYIKDFPLQVERAKELIQDFIKKLSATYSSFSLQSVYLTSALQETVDEDAQVLEEAINSSQRSVQLFQEPTAKSRSYFIKQFITHGLAPGQERTIYKRVNTWKSHLAFAFSALMILAATFIFGRDFGHSVQYTNAIKSDITQYNLAIQQIQDPDGQLAKTIDLLNTLEKNADGTEHKFDLTHLLNFYTHKSQEKASVAYHQALQLVLLPELRNYLGEYLRNPVNRNADNVYATLKAYLMLGDATHFDLEYITSSIKHILPKALNDEAASQLLNHLNLALKTMWNPLPLNIELVQQTRRFLTGMSTTQLSYIILKNVDSNTAMVPLNLGINRGQYSVFVNNPALEQVPAMFTAKSFANIISQEAMTAAQEASIGNWILGADFTPNNDPTVVNALMETIRATYVSTYISTWEKIVSSVEVMKPTNLMQTDALIQNMISADSPLLQLLQTIHDNTYFEPITTTSAKLYHLGLLVDKSKESDNILFQVFSALQQVHQSLEPIMTAENEKKAAFEAVANRMQHQGTPDVITQLLIVADKCPEPVKSWLNAIANDTWRYLMQDAARYIDFSWHEQVGRTYDAEIANRYPFSTSMNKEVKLQHFVAFFGNPGIVMNFYNQYLQRFIDTSKTEWSWKTIDGRKLPFSDETLHQIQTAMNIHHTFFPNGDNKLFVQFTLQPHKIGKEIKNVRISLNDKQITDTPKGKSPHIITWPNTNKPRLTTIRLTMNNQNVINKNYSGEWGLFKLVNESFETIVSKKSMVLNLSMDEHPAQYLLLTEKQFNPFLTLNLKHFHLPHDLTENIA